jgi:predicted alpha-1,2-mannosidase
MKRSAINKYIAEAPKFFKGNNFTLPPHATWTPQQWHQHDRNLDELCAQGLGWDVTDSATGQLADSGAVKAPVLCRTATPSMSRHGSGRRGPIAVIARTISALLVVPTTLVMAQATDLYDAVDPYIGTVGGGLTSPAAQLPFGMIQWGPATSEAGYYTKGDRVTYGYSLTHLNGVGCPIGSDLPILPWSEEPTRSPGAEPGPTIQFVQGFDYRNESAHPGFYSVTLKNGTKVELTVTERAGIARFTFPQGQRAGLLIKNGSSADTNIHYPDVTPGGREHDGSKTELIGDDAFTGAVTAGGFCQTSTHYTLYMAAKFDHPVERFDTWHDGDLQKGQRRAEGKRTGAWLDFGDRREIQMKIGLSYTSEAGALRNLQEELPGWNFDEVQSKSRQVWKKALDLVQVEGGTADQNTIFATALYHTLLAPTLFSDTNGDYVGFDWKVHSLAGTGQHAQYANFSDWDTYRNTIQLQALLFPRRTSDIMQSLVNDAIQDGWLPRWPLANQQTYIMNGDSANALLASGYAFGGRDFDTSTALRYMVKGGTQPADGSSNFKPYEMRVPRPFLAEYLKYGFVPATDPLSASRTLEYAVDDFAIAQFAKQTGDNDAYRHFLAQSSSWKNLLDPTTGWIRPRYVDGRWLEGFDAELSLPQQRVWGPSPDQYGFQEGNTAQYTFMPSFDYPREFAAMGGDDKAIAKLDKIFCKESITVTEACFSANNEPDFVAPYAYVFAGAPWKTQKAVSNELKREFNTSAAGIPGNDDLGATSGFYVWNAIGMYPAIPGVGGVVLGTPMFKKVVIHLGDGRTLSVQGLGTGPYVQKVLLNGVPYPGSWLPLASLGKGASDLQMFLDTKPNKDRGRAEADRPPSFQEP